MLRPNLPEIPARIRDAGLPIYFCETKVGRFSIESRGDRWHIMFKGESLGSYARPEQAADDLAGGHTYPAGPGIDTSMLGISENLSEWSRVRL